MIALEPYVVVTALITIVCLYAAYVIFWYKKIREFFLTGEKQELQLIGKTPLSANTFRLRFALDGPTQRVGLPVLQHIVIFAPNIHGKQKGKWNGKEDYSMEEGETEVKRPYTPITGDEARGYVDFVTKVYRPRTNPSYPDGGKCSRYIDQLRIGDKVSVRGPLGQSTYLGDGQFQSASKQFPGRRTRINLIAGGTGITPCLRLMDYILTASSPSEQDIEISLIFGNQSEDDIICRGMLDHLQSLAGSRLKIWYTLDQASPSWEQGRGYVSKRMIMDHLFKNSTDTITGVCGPPVMRTAVINELKQCGFDSQDIIFF